MKHAKRNHMLIAGRHLVITERWKIPYFDLACVQLGWREKSFKIKEAQGETVAEIPSDCYHSELSWQMLLMSPTKSMLHTVPLWNTVYRSWPNANVNKLTLIRYILMLDTCLRWDQAYACMVRYRAVVWHYERKLQMKTCACVCSSSPVSTSSPFPFPPFSHFNSHPDVLFSPYFTGSLFPLRFFFPLLCLCSQPCSYSLKTR